MELVWKKVKRHPTIEKKSFLGAGSIVLGPITVGREAKIGAGSVVVRSVPPVQRLWAYLGE